MVSTTSGFEAGCAVSGCSGLLTGEAVSSFLAGNGISGFSAGVASLVAFSAGGTTFTPSGFST